MILPNHLGENCFSLPEESPFDRRLCGLEENDEIHVAYVLLHTKGDKKQTAEILGITVRQVQMKVSFMKKNPYWNSFFNDI